MTTSDRNETVVNGYLSAFHSAQIEKLPAGDDPYQPLHPRAFASVERSGVVKTLSRQFYELLADAGLTMTKVHRRSETAPGRDGPREMFTDFIPQPASHRHVIDEKCWC